MRNFFEKLLGGRNESTSSPKASESEAPLPQVIPLRGTVERGVDADLQATRERNMKQAIASVLNRPPTEEEANAVRAYLNKGDAALPVPPVFKHEIEAAVAHVAREQRWSPDAFVPVAYTPLEDPYPPMGARRQEIFERALEEVFEDELSLEIVKATRAIFEGDAKIRAAWPTMVSEEVRVYAYRVARAVKENAVAAAAK